MALTDLVNQAKQRVKAVYDNFFYNGQEAPAPRMQDEYYGGQDPYAQPAPAGAQQGYPAPAAGGLFTGLPADSGPPAGSESREGSENIFVFRYSG